MKPAAATWFLFLIVLMPSAQFVIAHFLNTLQFPDLVRSESPAHAQNVGGYFVDENDLSVPVPEPAQLELAVDDMKAPLTRIPRKRSRRSV